MAVWIGTSGYAYDHWRGILEVPIVSSWTYVRRHGPGGGYGGYAVRNALTLARLIQRVPVRRAS